MSNQFLNWSWRIVLIIGLVLFGPLHALAQEVPLFPEGKDGAIALLEYVLKADEATREQLTIAMEPTREDCDSLIKDKRLARKVFQYQKYLARHADIILKPLLPEQTEWILWQANAASLIAYEGDARQFPGGYRELAEWLKPDVSVYRFKFIEPGRKMGTSYDLLVFINGHWRLIHRTWIVLF